MLTFITSIPEIDKIVVGVDNPKHLDVFFHSFIKKKPLIYRKFKSKNLNLIDPRRW